MTKSLLGANAEIAMSRLKFFSVHKFIVKVWLMVLLYSGFRLPLILWLCCIQMVLIYLTVMFYRLGKGP